MHDSVDRRQQPTKNASTSVVIWHGFGDRYDNPAFTTMIQDIRDELGNDTFVHVIRLSEDGAADSKATVFGHMASQVEQVANQLKDLPQLADAHFDAIGFSQGGVFFRGYVELFGQNPLYPKVRNLITLGSPHMGIAAAPLCQPTDYLCKTAAWALKTGAWTSYAQNNIIPAQYFRSQARINQYLAHFNFLKEINNERLNDLQPALSHRLDLLDESDDPPRNKSYYKSVTALNNFVLFNFDLEANVIPTTSPWFTLPAGEDDPDNPLPWLDLPLYREDYIGLRQLDESGRLHRQTCRGPHMQIDNDCWRDVMAWLGKGGRGRGRGGIRGGSANEQTSSNFVIQSR